jgi:hypothetical protein
MGLPLSFLEVGKELVEAGGCCEEVRWIESNCFGD